MIKLIGKLAVLPLALIWGAAASAQAPDIAVKLIGASYFEAPPNRDKNLAIFSTGSSLERVEIHAVATSASKVFAELTPGFEKHDISVTAVLPDKTMLSLGEAAISAIFKVSNDAKARTFNLKLDRLPDRAISGLIFEGALPVQVAKGFLKLSAKFEARAGSKFALGDVKAVVEKLDGQTLTLAGDLGLTRLRSIAIKQADGRVIAAERYGYSVMNAAVETTWKFTSAPASGTLEAELYQPLEAVKVPIRFVIGKPY